MPITYVNIATQTLGSNQASVTFSSIPQTYTDLALKISGRISVSSQSEQIRMRYNSNSSTVYSETDLGAPVQSGRYSNETSFTRPYINANSSTANTFGSVDAYIPNYTSSATKQGFWFSTAENNSTTDYQVLTDAQYFNNTTAISSITFFPASGSFLTNSTFYLYGIKNS